MSTSLTTYEECEENARTLGAQDGESAASWYFDGNTTSETYARVLRGIDDGDPEILGTFPGPDLSGQWADATTPRDFVPDGAPDWTDDLCLAYEDAFILAVSDYIEQVARYHAES